MTNENILVFDTETLDIENKLCYNLGYVIADKNGNILTKKDYVIKQVWEDKNLMNSAYYKEKKPIYIKRMKSKTTIKTYWGNACINMIRDIKKYNVKNVYAYNSTFDVKVIKVNQELRHCKTNPLQQVIVNDIMDYIRPITTTREYKNFCFNNGFITKHKHPRAKQTAESVYSYITNNNEYKEEHTAVSDSIIELAILIESWKRA